MSGMIVAGFARRVEKIKEIADSLKDSSGKLYPVECDVSKEDSVVAAFAWVKDNLGSISVLVNSAGITKESSLIGKPFVNWAETFMLSFLLKKISNRVFFFNSSVQSGDKINDFLKEIKFTLFLVQSNIKYHYIMINYEYYFCLQHADRWYFGGLAVSVRRERLGTLPLHARGCTHNAWDGSWRCRRDSREQFGCRESTLYPGIQRISGFKACHHWPRHDPATRACGHAYTRYCKISDKWSKITIQNVRHI